ncbi:hypothetical protein L1049_026804 [Liquidambar formosana]|uniref:RING-type domain-containing protein n=1 Tax=Liquidambar formosana TaxID=63359 RepID=A0AAP0R7M4_LIQFO
MVASSPLPPAPPLSLYGITALIFIYVIICYLVIDLIGRTEDISFMPSGTCDSSPGLSLEELEKIPCFEYGAEKTWTCAVCLDGVGEGERCRIFPVCKHVFHAQCIDLWLLGCYIRNRKNLPSFLCWSPYFEDKIVEVYESEHMPFR